MNIPNFLSLLRIILVPVFVSAVEAGPYTTTMRFVHVRPADATFHKGETLPYEIKVYAW